MWCRNRVVFLAFGACLLFVVLYILPKDAMLEKFSYTKKSIEWQEEETNVSENAFLLLLQHFTTTLNEPLFLLDKDLVDCLDKFIMCATKAQESKGYLLFGYFTKIPKTTPNDNDSIPDLLPPKKWLLESRKDSTIILVNKAIKVVLIFMDDQKDYWFLSGCSEVGFPASALVKSQNLVTVNIEGSQSTQLSLANYSKKLMKQELSSMRLLYCNETVAAEVRRNFSEYYVKGQLIDDSLVDDLAYLRDNLLSIDMPVFLMGGTLLGWYRECGIIPFTTDMDVCAQISDYDDRIESLLYRDKRLKIYWRLGKPEDSLEYSVFAGKIKFDIFFLYQTPDSSNKSWVGGMIMSSRTKLRWSYPIVGEVCSAVLKNRLFHVPCNVEGFLEADYGKSWHIPLHDNKFVWHSSHHNVEQVGVWTSKEWHRVYKVY